MRQIPLAVVGGGPAGLSAAIAAARAGVAVTLFDEQPALSGQLRYRLGSADADFDREPTLIDQGRELVAAAERAGVTLRPNAVVWGIFAGRVLGVAEPGASTHLKADQIVLATGSTDLPAPFPGGSLPGVLTARAVQLLLHVHRVRPGDRFAIIGDGPETGEVRRDIEVAGGQVLVTVDHAEAELTFAQGGHLTVNQQRFEVDCVVIAAGRQPDVELAMMAECDCAWSAELGGYVPLRDADLRSSVPGIIVAGDAAGICSVEVARAEGTFAGISAAFALGALSEDELMPAREVYLNAVGTRVDQIAAMRSVPVHV